MASTLGSWRSLRAAGSCTKPVVTLVSLPVKQGDVALAPRPIVVMPRQWVRVSFHPGPDFRVGFPNRIMGLLRIVWTTFQYVVAEGPLAQGSYEFSWIRKLGTNQRCEDVGGGGHIPLPRRDRRVRNSVSALPYGRVAYLQIPSLRWVCRLVVRHGQLYREMETAEISCPGCGSVRQKTLLWT